GAHPTRRVCEAIVVYSFHYSPFIDLGSTFAVHYLSFALARVNTLCTSYSTARCDLLTSAVIVTIPRKKKLVPSRNTITTSVASQPVFDIASIAITNISPIKTITAR